MTRLTQASLMIAAMIIGLAMVGCAGDLYGECSIEADQNDEILAQCEQASGEDDSQQVSCVVEEQVECETGACGRYRSSESFCTTECSTDDDCPSGECREFVYQSGKTYCVAYSSLEE